MDSLFLFFVILCIAKLSPCFSSHVSLSVSPKNLSRSGDKVWIQWSGVESPSDLDWLGIYSPPDSTHDNFIGYVFLSSAEGWKTGAGAVELPLVNLRSNYAFRIFRWTRDEVDNKHHDHDQNPLRGRGIFWCFVNYGEEGRMDGMVKTEVTRYSRSDMCDAPANTSVAWRDPGFIHDGVMRNLKMGRRYYYRVGSDSKGWSSIKNFTSRDNNADETIAFLFGDMGAWAPYATFRRLQEESKTTVKWILRDIEALGNKPAFGYSWIWDEFFNQIEPIASQVPYHVCIGNHEYDWPLQPWKPSWSSASYGKDGGGECGVPYSLKFRMPGNSSLPTGAGAVDTKNLYYSFDSGPVHFLYISTETNFLPGSDQHNFIKHDLEGLDRGKTPFVVVQGHRPMYTTSNEVRDAPLRQKFQESLEPLLVENNVTLALWGHVHRYERFCPMKNFKCVDGPAGIRSGGAPVHVVIGMAGQDWQPVWEPRANHPDEPIFPQPEQSMYRGGEFGYTRLTATKEKLTLTYVGNHDGEVHDTLEILSGYGAQEHGDNDRGEVVVLGSPLSWYVKGASVLLLGGFVGYVLGFVSRCRREAAGGNSWTPVKSEEV
ncbi:unnamed protein product [Spirodela intermedia]|uniref:Purple acid phosphatase n=1 Tax=Spirodela intermedia TaxID=51605 RepID=A0A7I8JB29_SPIIN|nr:unnamed protein product [Spirodela intermedia]CAA6667367.1 unnamed protein product [Spirodela intermedia]